MPVRKQAGPSNKDLEKALATLKSLGFKVTPPTSEKEAQMQEESLSKLGLKAKVPKKVARERIPQSTKIMLGATHSVGGTTYGPGEVLISNEQPGLIASLIYQDNLARLAHMDSTRYNPVSNCFIIKPGNGLDRHNKYTKQQVSESQFNSERIWEEVAVSTGSFDIAGYNPSFHAEHRSF